MKRILTKTKEVACRRFPNEIWEEQSKNVYVAYSREPKNKNQKEIFEKDFMVAEIAAKHGHIVFLLPERGGRKHPDAVMDGELTEIKTITGGENAISKNFGLALEKSKNVLLKIDSNIGTTRVKEILRGKLKDKPNRTGVAFCYMTNENKFYEWDFKDLKKKPGGENRRPL